MGLFKKDNAKSTVTTVTGIVLGLVTVAGTLGYLTLEQVEGLKEAIPAIAGGIATIVLIFAAKDGNK